MKPGSTKRNVVLGAVYIFALLVVMSALTGGATDESAPEQSVDEPEATQTTATDGGQEAATDGGTEAPTEEPEQESTPEPVSEPDPMTFSSSGATVTDRFTLEGGFTAFEYVHTGGSSNFIVEVQDPSGSERDRLVANEIGETEGGYGEGISNGEYVMNVEADGDWEIVVHQPRAAEGGGEDVPLELSGDASDDYVAVNLDGLTRVHGTHEGEGNFIVHSFARDGERHMDSLVFNEIGQFEGETTVQYDGTSWIVIEADGPWTLRFEPA